MEAMMSSTLELLLPNGFPGTTRVGLRKVCAHVSRGCVDLTRGTSVYMCRSAHGCSAQLGPWSKGAQGHGIQAVVPWKE